MTDIITQHPESLTLHMYLYMYVCVCVSDNRFLEHFIQNGADSNALEAVLAQLNDPKRQNPQELDNAVIGKDGKHPLTTFNIFFYLLI